MGFVEVADIFAVCDALWVDVNQRTWAWGEKGRSDKLGHIYEWCNLERRTYGFNPHPSIPVASIVGVC